MISFEPRVGIVFSGLTSGGFTVIIPSFLMFNRFLFYCVLFYERTQNFCTIHPLNISIAIWFNYRFDTIITITNNFSMTIIFISKLLTRTLMWLIVSNRQLLSHELITLFTSLIIGLR